VQRDRDRVEGKFAVGINPFLSHGKYWDESLGAVPLKVSFELTRNSLFRADKKALERHQSAPLNLPSGVEHLLDLTDHDLSSNEIIKQAIISNTSLAVASPRTVFLEPMVDSSKFSMS
jgi:hypothetical protein